METIDQYDAVGATDTLVAPGLLDVEIKSLLRENAGFGNLTYHFGPHFDLQGGVRYDRIEQEYGQPYELSGGLTLVPPLTAAAAESKATYLGAARYHFDKSTMLYARMATGYRPGGPNAVLPSSTAPATYQADNLTSYEFGLKGSLASNVLDYTVDVYRIEWRNIQVVGVDPVTHFGFFANGGKAHSQGLELALDYRPLAGLRMAVSGSVDDAKLDENIGVPGAAGQKGDDLPYAPQIAATGTLDYSHALGAQTSGFAGLTVAHVGSRRAYFNSQLAAGIAGIAVSAVGPLPAYTTLDLRGGVIWRDVTVTLYARNVTNELGALALNAEYQGVGPSALTVIQPRTFGLTVRHEFE